MRRAFWKLYREEILARFDELGVRVSNGRVRFQPNLLRVREFVLEPRHFRYLDVDNKWQDLTVPANGLAFTWCQVPIVYQLDDKVAPSLTITWDDGKQKTLSDLTLSPEVSSALFKRSGRIRHLSLVLGTRLLLSE